MIRKFIHDKLSANEPILPITKPRESKENELRPISKEPVKVAVKRNSKKSEDESEDLFKEMEPKYVAARRIGTTMLSSKGAKKTSRFDMEAEGTGSWDVEDLN